MHNNHRTKHIPQWGLLFKAFNPNTTAVIAGPTEILLQP